MTHAASEKLAHPRSLLPWQSAKNNSPIPYRAPACAYLFMWNACREHVELDQNVEQLSGLQRNLAIRVVILWFCRMYKIVAIHGDVPAFYTSLEPYSGCILNRYLPLLTLRCYFVLLMIDYARSLRCPSRESFRVCEKTFDDPPNVQALANQGSYWYLSFKLNGIVTFLLG